MTLQDFCLTYAYRPTTVSGAVRAMVLEQAEAQVDDGKPFAVDIRKAGLKAVRKAGDKRITYDVYEPEKLRQNLSLSVGYKNLLTPAHVEVLIKAAIRWHEWLESRRKSTGPASTMSPELRAERDELRAVLRKIGLIPDL